MSVAGEHKPGDRCFFGPFEFRPSERLLLCRDACIAAEDVLRPLLASVIEGGGTQDHIAARSVLSGCGVDPP